MDERIMFELLEIYDAVNDLEKVEEKLVGAVTAVGPGEGILGNLSYVSEIIKRHSPVYSPGVDFENSYFGQTLEDADMDNHRKARILLGIAN